MAIFLDYFLIAASALISILAFLFGAFRLPGKGTPPYFTFLTGAVGCYALEEICAWINCLCGNITYSGFQVSMLGTTGCFLFILTAEYGILDKNVRKTEKTKKAGKIALLAPVSVLAFSAFWIFATVGTEYLGSAVLAAVLVFPLVFSSYYTLRHLLSPKSENPCLRAARLCESVLLVFFAANLAFLVIYFFCPMIVISLMSLFLALNVAVLVFACDKGAKLWKT